MQTDGARPGQVVDLTNCDKEPIHIPGGIQPHGVLLVLQEPALTIRQMSVRETDLNEVLSSVLEVLKPRIDEAQVEVRVPWPLPPARCDRVRMAEVFDMLQMTFQRVSIPNPLHRCTEGEEALEFLHQTGRYAGPKHAPRPGLVLLDLNLAGLDGRQVLEQVKNAPHLKSIPVLVFSTSDNPKDVQSAYANGASGYLLKPVDLPRFERMIQLFKDFWLDHIVLPEGEGREGARR